MTPDQPDSPSPNASSMPEDSGSLSQGELDQLMAALAADTGPLPGLEGATESTPESESTVQPVEPDVPIHDAMDDAPDAPSALTLSGPREADPMDSTPLPGGEALEPDAVVLEHTLLNRFEIDHLLGADADQPLVKHDLDEVITPAAKAEPGTSPPLSGASEKGSGSVGQSEIDALLAALAGDPAPSASPMAAATVSDDTSLDASIAQDILAALMSADSEGGPASAQISNENLAAAVPTSDVDSDLISQDILDALVAEAGAAGASAPSLESGSAAAATPALEPTISTPKADADLPGAGLVTKVAEAASEGPVEVSPIEGEELGAPALLRLRGHGRKPGLDLIKAITSLAAGILFSFGTYTFLSWRQETVPDLASASASESGDLTSAVEAAREKMKSGSYSEAFAILDPAIAAAPEGPLRTDARYLCAESQFHVISTPAPKTEPAVAPETGPKSATPPGQQVDALLSEIDAIVKTLPDHPRASEALSWKAQLYELNDNAVEAGRTYDEILTKYGNAPHLDAVLLAAGKLAVRVRLSDQAIAYLNRLIEEYPGSSLVGDAHLELGAALTLAGDAAGARQQFTDLARTQPDTKLGREAMTRLADLAFNQGHFDEAIQQLEERLSSSTSVEGNEPVYLLLARSYRAAGRSKDAERVLRELLDFFEPTDVTPKAMIALSQVLDEQGQREEAKRLASQAVMRYPQTPEVLTNQAVLLARGGDYAGAAAAYMAADQAGATDPDVLLAAGRNFHLADQLEDARNAFQRLVSEYAAAPQAFEGSIELAKTHYELGQIRLGLGRLEDLALASDGRPQQLPVLLALGSMYQELGLYPRSGQIYRQVATMTAEPEVLARSAVALLDAGSASDALLVARRVDVTKLSGQTAYSFLTKYGQALLRTDSSQAIDKMEQAYAGFPEERTPQGDQALLEAYLTTDRSARARALVMELDALARRTPVERYRLEQAATAWGDYLYRRGDYRAAADAYGLMEGGTDTATPDAQWAAYQRANALLQLGDFDGSAALFEQIAAASAPWSQDARVKADYIKVERRLRDQSIMASTGGSNSA